MMKRARVESVDRLADGVYSGSQAPCQMQEMFDPELCVRLRAVRLCEEDAGEPVRQRRQKEPTGGPCPSPAGRG